MSTVLAKRKPYDGKVAFVTGASRDILGPIARRFPAEGGSVGLNFDALGE